MSFILIRHGLSTFNQKQAEVKTKYGADSPEYASVKNDLSEIDSELHPIGIKQCEDHQMNETKFKVVFVSPLRRALQTAIHMFKTHPDKKEIQFIILPIAREVMGWACDIAVSYDQMKEEFGGTHEGIFFDFSMFGQYATQQMWQVNTYATI